MLRTLGLGAAAGAVGTAVLNIATYGDMAMRGRPSSSAPQNFVKQAAASAGITALTADDDAAANRRTGVGSLLGYANGLGVGAVYGLVRPALRGRVPLLLAAVAVGAATMALSDVPLARSGVSDPKTWSPADWAADIVPHTLFGLGVALAFDALDTP